MNENSNKMKELDFIPVREIRRRIAVANMLMKIQVANGTLVWIVSKNCKDWVQVCILLGLVRANCKG